MSEYIESNQDFEDGVRRIARLLWPTSSPSGAEYFGGQEYDGVFVTEDIVHAVEATVSRRKEKAEQDIGKLIRLLKDCRKRFPEKGTKGWFVTKEEPTVDQRAVGKQHDFLVNVLSYQDFCRRLIDAAEYLRIRGEYLFGSAEAGMLDRTGYIEQMLSDRNGQPHLLAQLAEQLSSGRRVVLLGDFGAGKSTTMRELFMLLRKSYPQGKTKSFPVLLNLRDHQGQDDPAEALERHAKRVGFHSPSQLVRAWRAGYVVLMLDGFDELTSTGWVDRRSRLTNVRQRSMTLIRAFIKETPPESGIALSGRLYFFDDNERELKQALGIQSFTRIEIGEFSEQQVEKYLAKLGWKVHVPAWFPGRPLLLCYLASRDLMGDLSGQFSDEQIALDPGLGWDALLDLVCQREAEIHKSLQPHAIRRVIERLASIARTRSNGHGPLAKDELVNAFKQIVGYEPDTEAVTLLQRLPGLRGSAGESEAREFVDDDLADAARAGDVAEFVQSPFSDLGTDVAQWQTLLGSVGLAVAARLSDRNALNDGKTSAALKHAAGKGYGTLAADLVALLMERQLAYTGPKTFVSEVIIPRLSLSDTLQNMSEVEFQDCIIQEVEFEGQIDHAKLPRFIRCEFVRVLGRVTEREFPADRFADCKFGEFADAATTTAAIMSQSLPLGVRVLMTILKKTFMQRGAGRQEGALYRGLDQSEQRLVGEILATLQKHGVLARVKPSGTVVWLPIRAHTARVRRLLASPNLMNDELIRECSAF